MEKIKIVEYTPEYAKSLAEMWGQSSEGWNGQNMSRSEEAILREHESATYLKVYLALAGKEVVGYCSLEKFARDQSALYVPLLNVRPDYHGKKVGKALVLKCVEETIKLGWPQLDLYTWAGNTKAVPLYKKCGFFWEKRDGSTHLMNFIPTVLRTEALTDYFQTVDWYHDSTRIIEVKPDEWRENGFDYFQYSWDKANSLLRIVFERTGRGIRLIETNDYLISASVHNHDLVFGDQYQIEYFCKNKSGKPLNISIAGQNDKNIRFEFDKQITVTNQETIIGNFFVDPVEKKQDTWITHPAVVSNLLINGKKAQFKVGIEPKFPGIISIVNPERFCFLNQEAQCYLELENNNNEDGVFNLILPEIPEISWEEPKHAIPIKANERVSVPLNYRLKQHFARSYQLPITVNLAAGREIDFKYRLNLSFNGYGSDLDVENEQSRELIRGKYGVKLSTRSNEIQFFKSGKSGGSIFITPPKLGKPFSSEFSTKEPDRIETDLNGDFHALKAYYSSSDFPDLELVSISRLRADGLFQQYYAVKNIGLAISEHDIQLLNRIWRYMNVIPYHGKYLYISKSIDAGLSDFDSNALTENWLCYTNKNTTIGITWEKNTKVDFSNGISFEHNFDKLQPGEMRYSQALTMAIGLCDTWQEFRNFALKENNDQSFFTTDVLESSINRGNPFVTDQYLLSFNDNRNTNFESEVMVQSDFNAFLPQVITSKKEALLPMPVSQLYDTLTLTYSTGSTEYQKRHCLFNIKGDEPVKVEDVEFGVPVLTVDNGVFTIKASANLGPTIYSLTTAEGEWFDHSFPQRSIKGWWNPWTGGIHATFGGLPFAELLKEKITANFTTLTDNYGNQWEGIDLSIKVKEHQVYKGLTLNYYYLLLPGTNVLCHTVKVTQNTSKYIKDRSFYQECFLTTGNDREQISLYFKDDSGAIKFYKGDKSDFAGTSAPVMCASDQRTQKLIFFASQHQSETHLDVGVSSDVTCVEAYRNLSIPDQTTIYVAPIFFVLSDAYLTNEELASLNTIVFK